MTIRLSTGLRNKLLDGGTTGGIKGAFNLGFLYLYSGVQPASADDAASGVQLAKVTVNGDGSTGVTFGSAASGTIAKAVAEAWRYTGLADGQAGWYRFSEATDTPGSASAVKARMDGSIGTSGADANIPNTSIATGVIGTVDNFTVTMPGA